MALGILAVVFGSIQSFGFAADIIYGVYIKEDDEAWAYAQDGGVAGSVGKSWMTDAFSLKSCPFPVEFRCHFAKLGWTQWTKVGDYSSSVGKQLEALEFRFPNGTPEDFGYVMIGRAHCAFKGWLAPVRIKPGVVIGTTGESRRLEAVQLGIEKIVP